MEHNKEQKKDYKRVATAATKGFNPVPEGGVVRPSENPHMPPKKTENKK